MLAELEGPLLARMTPDEMYAVQRYTQLASTAVWVTDADVLNGKEPEKSLIFGLAKSIMTEQPSFHLCSLDIDYSNAEGDLAGSVVLVMETENAFHDAPNGDLDTEMVEKGGLVYISRYVADDVENADFERHFTPERTVTRLPRDDKTSHSLHFERVGKVESFYFKEQDLRPLGGKEILVNVDAASLDPLVR